VHHIVEEIEHLHWMGALRRNESRSANVTGTLACCLQELRAIAALDARNAKRRPDLRIV